MYKISSDRLMVASRQVVFVIIIIIIIIIIIVSNALFTCTKLRNGVTETGGMFLYTVLLLLLLLLCDGNLRRLF